MPTFDLSRRGAAELLGTWLLVATVVGSGIMAESLADGNLAVALLGNTLATGAMLVVLIATLGPISGAHFNPAVTLIFALGRELAVVDAVLYVGAQIVGGIAGTITAHLMFDLPLLQASEHARSGTGQWASEAIAAFGLIGTILGCRRFRAGAMPAAVALYVVAGYWFTASTCFANPAVTIARSFTNTFSGIRPIDVPWFVLAEIAGALIGAGLFRWLLQDRKDQTASPVGKVTPVPPMPQ